MVRWTGPRQTVCVLLGSAALGVLLSLQWPLAHEIRPCVDLITHATYYRIALKAGSFTHK